MTLENNIESRQLSASPIGIPETEQANADDIRHFRQDWEDEYYPMEEYLEPADAKTIKVFSKDTGDLLK